MNGGIFGSLFDFNGDGKLDFFEQHMGLMALQEIMGNDTDDEQEALERDYE